MERVCRAFMCMMRGKGNRSGRAQQQEQQTPTALRCQKGVSYSFFFLAFLFLRFGVCAAQHHTAVEGGF